MKIPVLTGLIRRRLLVNYRIAPEAVRAILPAEFQPKLTHGYAIAGLCLIRLEEIRPKGFPRSIGLASENAAHRIAVEWKGGEGVFIPRRDTGSRLNALSGGRLFPGVHHHSEFQVTDDGNRIEMRIVAADLAVPLVELDARAGDSLPSGSVFKSLDESSAFFEKGCVGYSARPDSCRLDGLLLKTERWEVSPLDVLRVNSAYFDDRKVFPAGSIEFDHALVMRDIPHEWHAEREM